MSSDLVPFMGGQTRAPVPQDPPPGQQTVTPGAIHGVFLLLHPERAEALIAQFTGWFADRDDVRLVDHGWSDKVGLGYLLLEWSQRGIDPLFLAIVQQETDVLDVSTYVRDFAGTDA